MKTHKFISDNGALTIEWIEKERRFVLWFEGKESGWCYVDKQYNNRWGSIEKDVLIDIKNAIEKVLSE